MQIGKTPQKETIEPRRNDIAPAKPKTAEHPLSESTRSSEQPGYRTRSGRQIRQPQRNTSKTSLRVAVMKMEQDTIFSVLIVFSLSLM